MIGLPMSLNLQLCRLDLLFALGHSIHQASFAKTRKGTSISGPKGRAEASL